MGGLANAEPADYHLSENPHLLVPVPSRQRQTAAYHEWPNQSASTVTMDRGPDSHWVDLRQHLHRVERVPWACYLDRRYNLLENLRFPAPVPPRQGRAPAHRGE